MDIQKVMNIAMDPKKYLYAGGAAILILFLLGVLAGYYIGENQATEFYIKALAEATKGCICL